jgi:hypothetical protein
MLVAVQMIGIARPDGTVLVLCSECGRIGVVPARLGPLRILAHYHHHETAEVP